MLDNKEQLNALLEDPTFRRAFLADYVQEILAAQIRAIREQRGWTQVQLGDAAHGMSQVQISRLENPDYSGASVNSLKRLAQALDIGLIIRYAPFSEFVDWVVNQSPERLVPPSFLEEQARMREPAAAGILSHRIQSRTRISDDAMSTGSRFPHSATLFGEGYQIEEGVLSALSHPMGQSSGSREYAFAS
jgi:transcriptional regulator with XRE-family HTH domain